MGATSLGMPQKMLFILHKGIVANSMVEIEDEVIKGAEKLDLDRLKEVRQFIKLQVVASIQTPSGLLD
jgi:hypothetical protein